MVKSALKNKEIEKIRPLDDAESLQVLQTLVKQRKESVEQFTKGGRSDLADKETKEIAIIEDVSARGAQRCGNRRRHRSRHRGTRRQFAKQMGAVIKAARAKLAGKTVDGKALSDRVRDRLSKKS